MPCLRTKRGGGISKAAMRGLKELTSAHSLAVVAGDLQLLDGKWYVTHSGLLRIAQRGRCMGINTVLLEKLSNPAGYLPQPKRQDFLDKERMTP
jgi:hypothetical protein